MLQTVSIKKVDQKETKTGKNAGSKFLVVETNDGRFSVFAENLFDQINNAVGKEVELDILTVGQYRNVIGVGKVIGQAKLSTSQEYQPDRQDKIDEATRLRRRTDLTMKAYDAYITGKIDREKVMDEALALISFVEGE